MADDGKPFSPASHPPPTIARYRRWQSEVAVGTWQAAQAHGSGLSEAEAREALERLDPLWDELFPAERARTVRLRLKGLASLVGDLGASAASDLRAAA
jgi:hypothetical protein